MLNDIIECIKNLLKFLLWISNPKKEIWCSFNTEYIFRLNIILNERTNKAFLRKVRRKNCLQKLGMACTVNLK